MTSVFLTGCSPMSSTSFLYSIDQLNSEIPMDHSHPNQQQPVSDNLIILFNSATCDNFEPRMWNYLYKTLFRSPPPSPTVVQKIMKSHSKNYLFKGRGSQRTIRDFSSEFIQLYTTALEFFSHKTEDQIVEELTAIENIRHPHSAHHLPIPPDIPSFVDYIQSTTYQLSQTAHSFNIPCLTEDVPMMNYVTFHKGMNMFEIAEQLEKRQIFSKKDFLRYCQDQNITYSLLGERLESVEGYLYPGTYSVKEGDTPFTLIQSMVRKFLDTYALFQRSYRSTLSRHQMVTLASLVEKEALLNQEKSTIASVFHNRLKDNMRLQSDPTVSYGILRQTGIMPKKVSKQSLSVYTPYNTYRVNGFPKGPITNPDRHSLNAVFNPRHTPFYYFVSKDGRTHAFSSTYEEHKRAIRTYLR